MNNSIERTAVRMQEQPPVDRRAWLKTSARWLALGGLGAMTAVFAARAARAERCLRPTPCGSCGLLAQCEWPRAVELKTLLQQGNHHGG